MSSTRFVSRLASVQSKERRRQRQEGHGCRREMDGRTAGNNTTYQTPVNGLSLCICDTIDFLYLVFLSVDGLAYRPSG